MKATFALVNPGNAVAAMTITMTVSEWKQLKHQLPQDYPSWAFASLLRQVIADAEKTFSEDSRSIES